MKHKITTNPHEFEDVRTGQITAVILKLASTIGLADSLTFIEYDYETKKKTGKEIVGKISHLEISNYGLKPLYVMVCFKIIELNEVIEFDSYDSILTELFEVPSTIKDASFMTLSEIENVISVYNPYFISTKEFVISVKRFFGEPIRKRINYDSNSTLKFVYTVIKKFPF